MRKVRREEGSGKKNMKDQVELSEEQRRRGKKRYF